MSIVKDNKEVVAVFKGSQPISHIFSGENLIFGKKERDYIKVKNFFDDVGSNISREFEDVLDELVNLKYGSDGIGYAVFSLKDNKLNLVRMSSTSGYFCSCISREYRLYSYRSGSSSHCIVSLDTGATKLSLSSYSGGINGYEFQHNGDWYVIISRSPNTLYKINSDTTALEKVKEFSNISYLYRIVYHEGLLYYTNNTTVYTYNMETQKEITYSGIVPSSVKYLQPVKCNGRICLVGYNDKNIYDFETREIVGTVDDVNKLGSSYNEKNFDNLCQLNKSILIYKDLEYKTIPLGVNYISYSHKYQIYAYIDTDGNAHICRIGTNEEILSFKGNFLHLALIEDYILLEESKDCRVYKLLLLNNPTETA